MQDFSLRGSKASADDTTVKLDAFTVAAKRDMAASDIAEVESFDPRTGSWSPLPSMLTPRHGLGGVAQGGRVFAIEGGPQPGLAFSSALEYLDVP